MKRLSTLILIFIFALSGCKKTELITFTAVVDDFNVNSASVTTADYAGFDKATVYFTDEMEMDFMLDRGQTVSITILPEIRESYPVQVSAVKIELVSDRKTAEYKKITAEEAKEIMDSGEEIIILDVRTKEEYDSGHIKGSILLPHDEIDASAVSLLPDKYAKLLVYCRTGRRSEIAAKALLELGYTDVTDFGGINDWPYGIETE